MASRNYCYRCHPLRVHELALGRCQFWLQMSDSLSYAMYFKGCEGALASGKKLWFAGRKLMISDILCNFHAANFLESTSQLFPSPLQFCERHRNSIWGNMWDFSKYILSQHCQLTWGNVRLLPTLLLFVFILLFMLVTGQDRQEAIHSLSLVTFLLLEIMETSRNGVQLKGHLKKLLM